MKSGFLLSPEHQTEVEPLLSHQVPSEPVGGGVGQEDDALGEAVAGPVHVRLLQRRLVRGFQLGLVHVHENPLFAQACDGADVVQRLAGYLEVKDPFFGYQIKNCKEGKIAEEKLFLINCSGN